MVSYMAETYDFEVREENSGIFFSELSGTKVSYDIFNLVYYVELKDFFEMPGKMRTII